MTTTNETNRYWYAAMIDSDDTLWGYGSYNYTEAVAMSRDLGPDGYIAVIEEGSDPICVDTIHDLV